MIEREQLVTIAVVVLVCAAIMTALHDRHYRRRRDVVRDARLAAIEAALPDEVKHKVLEARVRAHEEILLEDETT